MNSSFFAFFRKINSLVSFRSFCIFFLPFVFFRMISGFMFFHSLRSLVSFRDFFLPFVFFRGFRNLVFFRMISGFMFFHSLRSLVSFRDFFLPFVFFRGFRGLFFVVFFSVFSWFSWLGFVAVAQEATQTIQLKPGWNSIYLEVQPTKDRWEDIFEGIDTLESIWTWNPDIRMVEFITSPSELKPYLDQWPAYLPKEEPLLTNLFTAIGGKAYLVKMEEAIQSVSLQIKGRPVSPNFKWKADSFNFVGFSLESGSEPFFETFFESTPSLQGQSIYRLSDEATWEKVEYPSTTQMQSGEGFWVYCSGASDFSGLLEVELEQGYDVSYGSHLLEQEVKLISQIENVSLSIQQTGDPLLQYYNPETSNFEPLGSSALQVQTDANKPFILRLGVDRSNIAIDSIQGGILEIKDNQGSLLQIPYSATKSNPSGIWIGFVEVDQVQDPSGDLRATASSFQFRVILETDDNRNTSLLREFKNETTGQRLSSVVFHFNTPQNMVGSFGSNLTTEIILAPKDATHPYKHKYHPDHDNLNTRFEPARDGSGDIDETLKIEVFNIKRSLQFTFEDAPKGVTTTPLGWGDRIFGGTYQETVTGLHKNPIQIQGNFWIQKVGD